MKKCISFLLLSALLIAATCCTPSKKTEIRPGETFMAGGLEFKVAGAYFAAPLIEDAEYERVMVVLSAKNVSDERVDVSPGNIFALEAGGRKCEYYNPSFQGLKGYIAAGEEREGQIAFKIPKGNLSGCILSAEDSVIRFEFGERELKKIPLPQYAVGDVVKIDQLEITVTSFAVLENTFEGGAAGKVYAKAEIFIQSVSAGAPSSIVDRHFRFFGNDFAPLTLFSRSLPDSLPTNLTAEGSIIVELGESIPDSVLLGVSRHISGEDYKGIILK